LENIEMRSFENEIHQLIYAIFKIWLNKRYKGNESTLDLDKRAVSKNRKFIEYFEISKH
jgi:hypothetical protein